MLADIRYAVRWLIRSPGFTLVAVASLAIGIGFNTAVFTLADALLFKPLPVASPDRLVDIFTSSRNVAFGTSSYPDYRDLRERNSVFEDIAGYSPMFAAMNLDAHSRLAMGEIVTGNYFQVLGVPVAIGRPIQPQDDQPSASRVAVVSYRYWRREMASAPDVIGRELRVRGNVYSIVGVAQPGFTGMVPLLAPELWIAAAYGQDVEPVGMHDTVPSAGTTRLERRGDRWMFLRGRLKPGKTIDDARANLDVLMSHLATEYASTNGNRKANLRATNDVHLHHAADGTIVAASTAVAAVVGVVLLIACANVASMLLARASSRQKEIGIRLALGASRARLVRQLVTEAFVMSALGAVGGIALTYWLTSIVASINLPLPFPLSVDLHVDGRVLVFTLMVTAAASLMAGLIPAIQASKPTLGMELRAGHGVSRATRWMSDGLVGGQMVLTAVLLIVAGLLTRTLIASYRTNVGFPVERLAVVSTDASMLRYSPERTRQFYDEALARVTAIPGVKSVALATRVPFSVNFNRWEVWVEGHHRLDEHGDPTETTTVSPEYFSTIGVPIVEGRGFTASDRPNTPLIAVVNEAMARRYWPGESAVGKIFHSRVADGPQIQIVGVVADYKVLTVSEPPTPFLHISRTQRPGSYAAIIARTGGDASALLRDMRRELLALEPNLVFVENQTMSAEVEATLLPVRAGAMLVSVVGGVAMLLAAIGLYGVIAYSVARRTREIGIRLALGAQPMEVLKLVMREGLAVALAGLVVGCLLATLAVRAIAGVLYGVRPGDPVSWLAASAVLLGVSALANLIPAWRAARVDPSIALRTE